MPFFKTQIAATLLKCFLLCFSISYFLACNNVDKKEIASTQQSQEERKVALRDAFKKYPDSTSLMLDLIGIYRDEGNYDTAMIITDREIKKDSLNAFLWNLKGTLYFENNDTLNAIRSLHEAVAIYPDSDYLISLGMIYAEIRNANALIIADELLKSDKGKLQKNALFIKGLYYNFKEEPVIAIPYFDKVLQLDFNYMYAYREKAIALYNLKKYKDAVEVLKRAVTLQNNFDEGYYWMGKSYEKMGMIEEAIQNYENALLYDKDYVEAREALTQLKKKDH
ncbi:MAG: tetratricopeptide repeat protein [Ginsengibacter sp.]